MTALPKDKSNPAIYTQYPFKNVLTSTTFLQFLEDPMISSIPLPFPLPFLFCSCQSSTIAKYELSFF